MKPSERGGRRPRTEDPVRHQGETAPAQRVGDLLRWLRATASASTSSAEEFAASRKRLEASSDRSQLIWAIGAQGQAALRAARYRDAAALYDEAASLAKRAGDERGWALALGCSAHARLCRCDAAAATRRLEATAPYVRASENRYLQSLLSLRRAWVELTTGTNLRLALTLAERGVAEASEAGQVQALSWTLGTLGVVALLGNDATLARHTLDQAIDRGDDAADPQTLHLFTTHRAACEVVAARNGEPHDLPKAKVLFLRAGAFATQAGAPEISFKAAAGLVALGLADRSSRETEGEKLAGAAQLRWEELRTRTDLSFFENLG